MARPHRRRIDPAVDQKNALKRRKWEHKKMDLPNIPPAPAPKSKQINARLTDAQLTALKVHCNRAGISTQKAIIAALTATVEGFPI